MNQFLLKKVEVSTMPIRSDIIKMEDDDFYQIIASFKEETATEISEVLSRRNYSLKNSEEIQEALFLPENQLLRARINHLFY